MASNKVVVSLTHGEIAAVVRALAWAQSQAWSANGNNLVWSSIIDAKCNFERAVADPLAQGFYNRLNIKTGNKWVDGSALHNLPSSFHYGPAYKWLGALERQSPKPLSVFH